MGEQHQDFGLALCSLFRKRLGRQQDFVAITDKNLFSNIGGMLLALQQEAAVRGEQSIMAVLADFKPGTHNQLGLFARCAPAAAQGVKCP
jgi:hypothetical protein